MKNKIMPLLKFFQYLLNISRLYKQWNFVSLVIQPAEKPDLRKPDLMNLITNEQPYPTGFQVLSNVLAK